MTTAVISNYLENALINHILRNTPYSSPGTNVWVSLHITSPGEDGSGTEVTGTGYGRQQVTAWDAPAARATANTNAIAWAAAQSNWGLVAHIGIWDAQNAGNLLFYGALNESKQIDTGVTFSINAGDIDVSLVGSFSNYLSHALLNHVLRNTAYTSPGTNLWITLYNTDPTAGDAGTEVTGTGYHREQCSAWDAPTDGATQNTNLVTMGPPTGDWTQVNYDALRDSDTAGNLLFFGAVDIPFTPKNGDTTRYQVGAFDVNVS